MKKFYLCEINTWNLLLLSGDLNEATLEFDAIVAEWIKYAHKTYEDAEIHTTSHDDRNMEKGLHYTKQIRIEIEKPIDKVLARKNFRKAYDESKEFIRLELSERAYSLEEVLKLDAIKHSRGE